MGGGRESGGKEEVKRGKEDGKKRGGRRVVERGTGDGKEERRRGIAKSEYRRGKGAGRIMTPPSLLSPRPLTSSRRTLQHLHYALLKARLGSVARYSTYNHIYNLPVRAQPQRVRSSTLARTF